MCKICRFFYTIYLEYWCLHCKLDVVLYQNKNGLEHVIAYGSRSLKHSEKLYPSHKLEFLCLKLAVVDKFEDYLYNNSFVVRTDSNSLRSVTTSAKFEATGHRWLPDMSNYICHLLRVCSLQILDTWPGE